MSIFKHSFEHLTEEQLEKVKAYFKACECHTATCTFLANYAWRDNYDLHCEEIGNFLCVSGMVKDDPKAKPIMLLPMPADGNWSNASFREVLLEAKKRFEDKGHKLYIVSLSEGEKEFLQEIFPDKLEFYHDEDLDEYVYLKEKLITLSGRALHKKKNHLNYFLKTYKYEVTKILPNMVDEVMDFVVQCKLGKGDEGEDLDSLHMEEDAIRRFLEHIDEDEIYSVAIYIEATC